jgi:hypothetical protein
VDEWHIDHRHVNWRHVHERRLDERPRVPQRAWSARSRRRARLGHRLRARHGPLRNGNPRREEQQEKNGGNPHR